MNKIKLAAFLLLAYPLFSMAHLISGPYLGLGLADQNFTLTHQADFRQQINDTWQTFAKTKNHPILSGTLGSAYVGWQVLCYPVWGAIEGEYQWNTNYSGVYKYDSPDRLFDPNNPETLDLTVFQFNPAYSASLLLGLEVLCNTAIYLRGGYQSGEFRTRFLSNNPTDTEDRYIYDRFLTGLSAYLAGIGIQTQLYRYMGIRLEYRYVGYQNKYVKDTYSPKWALDPNDPTTFSAVKNRYNKFYDNQMILSVNYVFDLYCCRNIIRRSCC